MPHPAMGLRLICRDTTPPDLDRLGDALYEWQEIRQKLIDLLADPDLDEQTALYLDSKLTRARTRGLRRAAAFLP